MPKLAHTKSTRGCRRCKQRKVKCDEIHPICGACQRHDVVCEYTEAIRVFTKPDRPRSATTHSTTGHPTTARSATTNSSPQNEQTPNSLVSNQTSSSSGYNHPLSDASYGPNRILELRLIIHFALETSRTMTIGGPEIWKPLLPKLGLSHGFLLDIILAWAALHLYRTDETDTEALAASRIYYERALEGQTQVLRNGIDNAPLAEALFINSALIAKHALVLSARGETNAEQGLKDVTFFQWLHIARGLRTIGIKARPFFIKDCVVHYIVSQKPDLLDHEVVFAPSNREEFQQLLDYGKEFEGITPADQDAYERALNDIGGTYIAARKGEEPTLGTCRRILTFASRADMRFIDMVEEQRPRALVILAHLLAAFRLIKVQYWWMNGVAERHVARIYEMMPQGWKPMMAYPMQLCNLDTPMA